LLDGVREITRISHGWSLVVGPWPLARSRRLFMLPMQTFPSSMSRRRILAPLGQALPITHQFGYLLAGLRWPFPARYRRPKANSLLLTV
jgi:hypothetical protein